MAEFGRDQLVIRHRRLDQAGARRELHQTVDGLAGYLGVVERRVTSDEAGDQLRLVGGKQPFADLGRERWICFQRPLSLDDRPYRTRRDLGMLLDELGARGERRKVVVARARRAVAAPQIEMQFRETEAFAERNAHSVAPIAVGRVLDDRVDAVSRHEALVAVRRRRRNDANIVALEIDAGIGQQVAQRHLRPRRSGGKPKPLQGLEIPALDIEIGAHCQEPVGILRQRAEELHALPFGERAGRHVSRSADEVELAVAHELGTLHRLVHELDIDAFLLE